MTAPADPAAPKLVAYYRVSTAKQGASGLGLGAQQATVGEYAKSIGGWIVASYTEVESGKRTSNRPELAAALDHARRAGAVLVIAKLDRLSRNASFLMGLRDAGGRFVACDCPDADETTVGVLALMAQREAKLIGQRTKDALAARKARGGTLGATNPASRNLKPQDAAEGRKKGAATTRAEAAEWAADLRSTVQKHANGKSLREAAKSLNAAGIETRRKKAWTAAGVKRVLDRSTGE